MQRNITKIRKKGEKGQNVTQEERACVTKEAKKLRFSYYRFGSKVTTVKTEWRTKPLAFGGAPQG